MRGSTRRLLLLSILFVGLRPPAPAEADTVTLTSGRILEDVQVKDEGDKILITKADGSSVAYPRSMIKEIKHVKLPAEVLLDRWKTLDAKDVKGRLDLARWCEVKKLTAGANQLYEEVLALDSKNEAAHTALGHIKVEAEWYSDAAEFVMKRHESLPSKDAASRVSLAQWCLEHKLGKDAIHLYEEAVAADPGCAEAHRGLGHVQVESVWYADLAAVLSEFEAKSAPLSSFVALAKACHDRMDTALLKKTVEAGFARFQDARKTWEDTLAGTVLVLTEEGSVRKRGPFRLVRMSTGIQETLKSHEILDRTSMLSPMVSGNVFVVVECQLESADPKIGPRWKLSWVRKTDPGGQDTVKSCTIDLREQTAVWLVDEDGKKYVLGAIGGLDHFGRREVRRGEEGAWEKNWSRYTETKCVNPEEPLTFDLKLAFVVPQGKGLYQLSLQIAERVVVPAAFDARGKEISGLSVQYEVYVTERLK